MAHRRRRKSAAAKMNSGRRHHRNPFKIRRRRHSRNPFAGASSRQILELGLGAVGGVLGSGYLSQMVLGGSNAGIMGYVGDAVSTLVLAWAANKYVGSEISKGVLAGGFGALFKRIWQEQFSGSAGSVSGLGNLEFAGLGFYKSQQFPLPTSSGQYALAAGAASPVAAAAASSVTPPVQAPQTGSIARYQRW